MDAADPTLARAAFVVLALTFAAIAASSCSGGHAREHALCVGAALFLGQLGVFVALAGFGLPPLAGRTIPLALGATAAGVLMRLVMRGIDDVGDERAGRGRPPSGGRAD